MTKTKHQFFVIFVILSTNLFVTTAKQGQELPNILERPKNILQQQNFHEPNRWRPPVRLIPFNLNRLRVFSPDEDESSSGSGSGIGTTPACDDEDGDCGDRTDVIKIETGGQTGSPDSPAKASSEPNATSVSTKKKLQTTFPTQSGDTVSNSIDTNLATAESGYDGVNFVKTTKMPTLSNVISTSNDLPKAEVKYWTKTDPGLTSKHSLRTADANNNINKVKIVTKTYHTTKTYTDETKNPRKFDQVNRTTTNRHHDTPLLTKEPVLYKENFSKTRVMTDRKQPGTSLKSIIKTKPTLVSTTRPRSFKQQALASGADSLKTNATHPRNISTVVPKIIARQTKNTSLPFLSVLHRHTLRQNVTALTTGSLIGMKTRTTMATLATGRKEIYENFVEKSNLNVCHGLLCGDGLCMEEGRDRGSCLCPIGKGGEHCEKETSFTHPLFSGSSYLLFNKSKGLPKDFSFVVEFKADDVNGVLIFGTDQDQTKDEFFALILVDGFLQFRSKCGPGFITISSSTRIKLGDWHRVIIRKRKNKVTIQTDGASVTSWMGGCLKDQIETRIMYLGGLPHNALRRRKVGLIDGFVGCLRKFIMNRHSYALDMKNIMAFTGLGIGDCSEGSCARNYCNYNGTCVPEKRNVSRCLCPMGKTGSDCSKDELISVPQFSGSGFLEFTGLGSIAWSQIEIEIVVKPESETALIFFNSDKTDGRGDFISLALKNGFVEFTYDCGTGAAVIRSNSKLSMHQWHVIRASRKGKFGLLHVNRERVVKGTSKGPFEMLKLRKPLFIGGIRYFTDIPVVAEVHSNFRGCIEKVLINKKILNWKDSNDGYDVTNCHSHECLRQRCSNHGRCESHKGASWCHCHLGYGGDKCEKETKIDIPMFNGHSYLKFEDKRLFKHLANPTSILSFEFKSTNKNGLLLWNGQRNVDIQPTGDFLSMALVDGYVICRYNLGDGEKMLNSTKQLSDGKWHEIKLLRMNGKGEMSVDKTDVIKTSTAGNYTMLNTDGELFIGGADDIARRTRSNYFHGFAGCFKNLKIGISEINLIKDAEFGHDITQCNFPVS